MPDLLILRKIWFFILIQTKKFFTRNSIADRWLFEHNMANANGIFKVLPDNIQEIIQEHLKEEKIYRNVLGYEDEYFKIQLTPLKDKDAVFITLTDITDTQKISLENEIFNTAFESSLQGMMITDVLGTIVYANKALSEMYGYEKSELIGQTPNILNPGVDVYEAQGISKEEYRHIFENMWDDLRDESLGSWEGEVVNKKKNGELVWVSLFTSAIRNKRGEIIAYLGMPVDISARRFREHSIRLECYNALTHMAEQKDLANRGHLKTIGKFARLLAEEMKMPKQFCEDIEVFSSLHDIGKVGLDNKILAKGHELQGEELDHYKEHTKVGYEILRGVSTLEMAAEIALSHHERWDGQGYPHGLRGEEIPLSARIVALADMYDTLRARREYKDALPHDQAVEMIIEEKGGYLSPAVVEAFERIADQFRSVYRRANKKLENGR